jgi:hypothetical protein
LTNRCWRTIAQVVGTGTIPVAVARVLTLVEIAPLVEFAPSVHTVGDGGHAARARDAGSGPAAVTP